MANEITVSAITGLTITIQLYSGVTPVGSAFPATEIGTTGEYVATVPGGIPYGKYIAIAIAGGNKIASGEFYWTGYEEMSAIMYEETRRLQGLDKNNPSTTTQLKWTAGSNSSANDIAIDITGDQQTITQMQRE